MSICFTEKQYFDIVQINFDKMINKGTCKLVNKHHSYKMIWMTENYPTEKPNMPGSLFPVQVKFTIFNDEHSINGEFVYELASGTLPYLSDMGIPYDNYKNYNHIFNIIFNFKLKKDSLELCIKPIKHKQH